jgi:endoglucanase
MRRLALIAALFGVLFALLVAAPTPVQAADVTATNAGDAYVAKASPNANFGQANPEKVRRKTTRAGNITYLRFTSPAAGTATLRLYVNTSATGNLEAHATAGGWTEAGLKWSNKPAVGALLGTGPLPASTGNVTIPVGAVPAGEVNLAVLSASTATKAQAFVSEEGSDVAQRPTLTVTPTPPPTTAPPTTDPPTTAPPTTPPATTDPATTTPAPTTTTPPAGTFGVRVTGNLLTSTLDGSTVQLRGVNRSGTEYACTEGWGIFDGPVTTPDLQRIKDWGANAVRVSLEEDCWLGLSNVEAAYGGANYRTAITDYVARLTALGLYVIIDEHGHIVGNSNDQAPMPDRANAPAFWASVAAAFAGNPAVTFDLFNEPYPDSNRDTAAAWTCVRDGGTCPGVTYTAAGMTELLAAVRNAGAQNVVMVGGPQYAGTLSQWLTYRPADPASQLAASIHIYYDTPATPERAPCWASACWDAQIAPVAATVPVVMGEIGEHDCTFTLIDGSYDGPGGQGSLVAWADAHHVSYLAWSWIASASSCASGPTLISAWDGTPNPGYGTGYRAWLLGPH